MDSNLLVIAGAAGDTAVTLVAVVIPVVAFGKNRTGWAGSYTRRFENEFRRPVNLLKESFRKSVRLWTYLWRFVFTVTAGADPSPSMLYNVVVVGSCSHNLHQVLVIECLILVIAFLWLRTRLIPTSLVFILFSFFLFCLLLWSGWRYRFQIWKLTFLETSRTYLGSLDRIRSARQKKCPHLYYY